MQYLAIDNYKGNDERLLIASHIKPWAKANNETIDFANHKFIGEDEEEGNSASSKIIVASVAGGFTVAVGSFVGVMIFKAKH